MSSLGAQPISSVTLHMPRYGSWRAEVICTQGDLPSGRVTLTVADLKLHGTVDAAAFDAPGKPRIVVVGGLGWSLPLGAPLSFASDAGVRLRSILRALASRSGEPIEEPADATLDKHWMSRGGDIRIRDVLSALRTSGALSPWRVDADGVTRFGARVGSQATARATEMRHNGVSSRLLGVDSVASFRPGDLLQDGMIIARTVVRETSGSLTAEVWS